MDFSGVETEQTFPPFGIMSLMWLVNVRTAPEYV
jgi:hypothetical protein